jgi:tRNA dimethylallyltransferase
MQRLLVIAGPTASGKTSIALGVAERVGGEIVSADAFAIYRRMDIGTDKPDNEQRSRIAHHLIDIVEPGERFSAGDFTRAADAAISDIASRGSVPVVAGGSHFYLHALLRGLFPSPPHDPEVRATLEAAWSDDPVAVYGRLEKADPAAAGRIGRADRQRILRALEVAEVTGVPLSEHWRRQEAARRYNAVVTAVQRPRPELYARIDARVDTMFRAGLVDEVEELLRGGVPETAHALRAIGYRQVVEHLLGRCSLAEAVRDTKTASRRLAKRQLSWLRRDDMQPVSWVAAPATGADGSAADRIVELWYGIGGTRE